MIDGKPSLLSGEELKQYLKSVDGANIKSVEIIANPSAKYDASGSAGIFNIVLKKSATGLTGNAEPQ
jgi:outer membrane receptor protein involved in Fe transport